MFKRVDDEVGGKLEGFSYLSSAGREEFVELCSWDDTIVSLYADGSKIELYVDDIPNMIKALQAAYDHNKGL